jgi:phage terminase large subunit-like protein
MSSSSAVRARRKAFSVEHFREFARLMVLDNGRRWELEDFQAAFVADLFAGYEEAWKVVPEGNAKTTLMSGVALYWGHHSPTARIVMAAAARDQCQWLFDQAAGFIERSPGFDRHFQVQDGSRRIKCLRTGSKILVFSADDRTGDGAIFDLALLDELHRHRDMRLYRTWRGKVHKRGGMVVAISTAGEPGTEFEDARAKLLADATEVDRDGFHTRAATADVVLHDYSVPRDADVNDMAVVKRANPLKAITVEDLAKKRQSPSMTETHWRRFVCNQAVRGEETAISPQEWADLGTDDLIPGGRTGRCGRGLRVEARHDRPRAAVLPGAGRVPVRCPRDPDSARDGSILPPNRVKEAFRRIHGRNPIRRVVIDPDRAAEIAVWLEDDLGVEVVEHLQSNQPMILAYDRWMESMRNRRMRHPRDPEFTEHVLNAMAKLLPDGSARFDRPSSSRAQAGQRRRVIDALIAAAMVHSVAVAEQNTAPVVPFVEAIYG